MQMSIVYRTTPSYCPRQELSVRVLQECKRAAVVSLFSDNAFLWDGHPSKVPLSVGISTPSNKWFLWPTRVIISNGISNSSAIFVGLMKGMSIGLAVFAQLKVERPYTLQWVDIPLKIAPFPWGSVPHLIYGSLGPPELPSQMTSRTV